MQKLIFFLSTFVSLATSAQILTGPKGEKFALRVVAEKLSDPWEVTLGPDSALWVTEAKGYRVLKIDVKTGSKKILLDINNERQFPRYDVIDDAIDGGKKWPQGGLMGLALHPQLLTGKPYVYLSYVHSFSGSQLQGNGCNTNFGGCFYTTRIVRYHYDITKETLTNPSIICDTIPGSNDHNAGRLIIAPDNEKAYLYYSVGDLGAGQFDNAGRTNHAQQIDRYEGKVLRFNTEPENENGIDQWIPADNPFNTTIKRNAVWSYGHRNAQGLAIATIAGKPILFSTEHGPFSDDEVNIIEKGKNYGHPLIIGYKDGNYNGLAAGVTDHPDLPGIWHTTYPTITSEELNAATIGSTIYRDPIKSFNPTPNSLLAPLLSNIRDHSKGTRWQSEAPSSIDVYTYSAIPGWKNSLLVPTLKTGKVIRLQLDNTGTKIIGDTLTYFKAPVRYRDLAISHDGLKLYVSVDSTTASSEPATVNGKTISYRGCILEFSYINADVAIDPSALAKPTPAKAIKKRVPRKGKQQK